MRARGFSSNPPLPMADNGHGLEPYYICIDCVLKDPVRHPQADGEEEKLYHCFPGRANNKILKKNEKR